MSDGTCEWWAWWGGAGIRGLGWYWGQVVGEWWTWGDGARGRDLGPGSVLGNESDGAPWGGGWCLFLSLPESLSNIFNKLS